MATIYHPATALEAVLLRKANDDGTAYLAGGTDDLRLGSPAEGKDLIDVKGLLPADIIEKEGRLWIGAGCSLQQVKDSPLVPDFIREAAGFCSSYVRRCSATVGGNLGARREDSYLAAALTAADAFTVAQTSKGVQKETLGDYLQSSCIRLLQYIVIDSGRRGWVKRFGNSSASHAAVIAAESEGVYAASIHGTGFICSTCEGDSVPYEESGCCCRLEKEPLHLSAEEFFLHLENLEYKDDLTGGAAYKKYLVRTAFGR